MMSYFAQFLDPRMLMASCEYRSLLDPSGRVIYLTIHTRISPRSAAVLVGFPDSIVRRSVSSQSEGPSPLTIGRPRIFSSSQLDDLAGWTMVQLMAILSIRLRDVAKLFERALIPSPGVSRLSDEKRVSSRSFARWLDRMGLCLQTGVVLDRGRHAFPADVEIAFFVNLAGLHSTFSFPRQRISIMDVTMVLSISSDFIGLFVGRNATPPVVGAPALTVY